MKRIISTSVVLCLTGMPAFADSLLDLLPPDDNPNQALKEVGIESSLSITQFLGGVLQGNARADTRWKYGTAADWHLKIDLSRFGLWDGLSINLLGQMVGGKNTNHVATGALLPVNTALEFPASNEFDTELSLNITQRLGDIGSFSIGKFNMVDAAAATPLVGGGGLQTFEHVAFASPPTGLIPTYIFGAMTTLKTPFGLMTFAVFDPRDMTDKSGLEDPFSDGVAGMINLTITTHIGGLPGFHTVTLRANNQEKVDLADIPDLILPKGAGDQVIDTKKGAYYIGYSFQQYLHQTDASHGWGIFGSIGFSDANPTVFKASGTLGIVGNSPIPDRDDDLFGVGYFYNTFSDDLVNVLAPIGKFGAEQGVEAFYNLHLASGVRLTSNVQVIDPALGDQTAVFAGLRLQTTF